MVEFAGEVQNSWIEKWQLLALNDTGKELVGTLEKAENSFTVPPDNQASKTIRAIDFKINSFERNGLIDPKTRELYEALLTKHLKSIDKPITSKSQYIDSSRKFISGMQILQARDGRNIVDTKVDAEMIEWLEAVYDGVSRGLEVSKNELKKQLETLVSPEEWQKIVEALIWIAKNPIQFMDLLIQWMKEWAQDVWKEIEVMWQNSTHSWFSAEMGKYIPEVGIPMIISSVGPGKFFKMLGLDKILPQSIMKKLIKAEEKVPLHHSPLDTLSVEKLRAMPIRDINKLFDGEVNAMKQQNLKTIFKSVEESYKGTWPFDKQQNRLGNDWMKARLWNFDNMLEIAVERGNPTLKRDIKTKVLEPLSEDIAKLKGEWLEVSMENQQKLSEMLLRVDQ